MLGAEPAQPSKAASKPSPLHPGPFFCTSLCPDPGATAKNRRPVWAGTCPCSLPTLQPPGKLVDLARTAPSARSALTTSLAWLASTCPSDLCLHLYHFLQEAFLDCLVGGSSPWVHHTALSHLCPPFTYPDYKQEFGVSGV